MGGHGWHDCCKAYGCSCANEDGTHDTDACMCTFEVNDMFKAGEIDIPESVTDAQILDLLEIHGYLFNANLAVVDDYSDGTTLDIVSIKDRRPLLTLDAEDES